MVSVKNTLPYILPYIIWCLLVMVWFVPSSQALDDCPRQIHESVKMDHDWFCPRGGPRIEEANVVLDCQNYSIKGSGAGVGVELRGDHSRIFACRIEGFKVGVVFLRVFESGVWDSWIGNNDVGVFLDQAVEASVVRSRLYGNKEVGILGPQASAFLIENEFDANGYDQQVGFLPTGKGQLPRLGSGGKITGAFVSLPEVTPRPMPVYVPPRMSVIENKVEEAMLVRVGVNQKVHAQAMNNVYLTKSAFMDAGQLSIMIVVRAVEAIEDLVVFEIISKNLTESVFDVSSKWPFSIVEHDPVIRFDVGAMEKGSEVQIVYHVMQGVNGGKKIIELDASNVPSSVLSFDKPLHSITSGITVALFWLYVVLFLVWGFLNRNGRNKMKFVTGVGLSVVVLVLFVSLQTRKWVIGSEWFHEGLLGLLLFSGVFYLGVQSFLLLVNAQGMLKK